MACWRRLGTRREHLDAGDRGSAVAILGDQSAYFIGRRIGPALFDKEDSRFFKKHYVTESHDFFEKHGP